MLKRLSEDTLLLGITQASSPALQRVGKEFGGIKYSAVRGSDYSGAVEISIHSG